MASVSFKLLTQAQWDALVTKSDTTLYRVQKTGGGEDFYQGSNKLNNAAEITAAIEALDASDFALATASNGVVTIKGIKEVDGVVEASADTTLDVTLAKVATTGAAEDISIVDAGGYITSTDVEGALQELASQSAGGVASKTVYITETAGSSSDPFSKRYGVYQGATGSSSSPVVSEKLVDIDIPKDMVVESGSVVDIVFVAADNSLHEGSASGPDVTTAIKGSGTATAADAGKYIKLVIANASSTALYIAAKDLVDIYTAQPNATQIQLAIDANNEISATIVAGSVGATELDSTVNASLALADSAVQSVTTGATNGTIAVDGTDVSVYGLGSAAYTASTSYDAAGSAAAVLGTAGDTASDNTVFGAKAYADSVVGDALEWETSV